MATLLILVLALAASLIYLAVSTVRLIVALFIRSIEAIQDGEWWGLPATLGLSAGAIYLIGLILFWW